MHSFVYSKNSFPYSIFHILFAFCYVFTLIISKTADLCSCLFCFLFSVLIYKVIHFLTYLYFSYISLHFRFSECVFFGEIFPQNLQSEIVLMLGLSFIYLCVCT